MNDTYPTRDVTIRELLDATSEYRDEDVLRWYQMSRVATDGSIHPTVTLRLTYGQARREIGWTPPT